MFKVRRIFQKVVSFLLLVSKNFLKMLSKDNIRNVCILGHIDHGKMTYICVFLFILTIACFFHFLLFYVTSFCNLVIKLVKFMNEDLRKGMLSLFQHTLLIFLYYIVCIYIYKQYFSFLLNNHFLSTI